jgi:D-threonine aldolase
MNIVTPFAITNTEAVDSPALLIHPDVVQQNIQAALALVGDPARLRPHVKTHKMPAVTKLLLAAGIRQFKCATIAEAEMLAQAEAPDVLLAYPVVGPKAARLYELIRRYPATRFSCLTDHPETARQLSDLFADQPLSVYIDLNVGMGRTGISPERTPALADALAQLPGLKLVGIHAYDGHIRATDLTERTQLADATYALAGGVRRQLEARLGTLLNLVMGGSPPFTLHAGRVAERYQCSPGTFVFWDAGYATQFPDSPFRVAAVLLTRVISVIDSQTLTLDLGHKSVAAESPLARRVVFPDHPEAEPIGQSEEHLVVRVPDATRHVPGEVWYGIPVHICPTVALYDRVRVVEQQRVTGHWAVTARDRQLSI